MLPPAGLLCRLKGGSKVSGPRDKELRTYALRVRNMQMRNAGSGNIKHRKTPVMGWQQAAASLAVGSCGSWELAAGSWELAAGSWQLAGGSWRLAVGSWWLAIGSCLS